MRVQLRGLSGDPALNGQCGKVGGFEGERVFVKLDNSNRVVKVKTINRRRRRRAPVTRASGLRSRPSRASKCCVCLEKDRDVVFMPCFHLVACWDCSKRMCECPICRKNIGQKRRVYN